MAQVPHRYEGRLFSQDGQLCYVLDIDDYAGIARVSCPEGNKRRVIETPLADVEARPATDTEMRLEAMSASSSRIVETSDGWFFKTREGLKGPYLSSNDAQAALDRFIKSQAKR